MGIRKYSYVMMGARLPLEMMPEDLKWDDKYLPYTEGHAGVPFTIHRGNDEDNWVYVGQVVAQSGPYDELQSKRLEFPSSEYISQKIFEVLGITLMPGIMQVWFFEVYL